MIYLKVPFIVKETKNSYDLVCPIHKLVVEIA